MNRRVIVLLLAFCTQWASVTSSQDVSDATRHREANALVRQLGDDRFAVRERATSLLIAMGIRASEALQSGIGSIDQEVRYRSSAVLAIIRDLDLQQRLDDFAQDSGTGRDYGLPGWRPFRELAGATRGAKALFVGMVRTEPKLMEVADRAPEEIGLAVNRRCYELRQGEQLRGIRHSTNSVAALLFLVGIDKVPLNPPTNATLYFFCQRRDVTRAMQSGPARVSLQRMLGKWLAREQNEPSRDAMRLGMQHGIHEVLPRALRTVGDPAVKAFDRQYAILAVAKFGDRSAVPTLEKLLDDKVVCAEVRRDDVTISIQVRDVALAALLHLDKRNLAESAYPLIRRPPFVFNQMSLGFETDERRQQALQKWAAGK